MDAEIETLYRDIIDFCKAASETLGQTTISSLASSFSTTIIPQRSQPSPVSQSSIIDASLSNYTTEQEPFSEIEEDKIHERSSNDAEFCWNEREDQVLLEVITNYKKNWDKIKLRIFKLTKMRKSVGFLRKRYAEIVSSTKEKKNTKYTHNEDLMIAHGILIHGFDWIKISAELPDRDSRSIKNRYYYHISKKNLMDSLAAELATLEWSQIRQLE
jgi:hypothetical protein